MPKPAPISEMFAAKMNASHATGEHGKNYRGFAAFGGRIYDKIMVMQSIDGPEEKVHAIHAFVHRETGDLIKAATIKAPQKNSDGTVAVRFYMGNEEEVDAVVAQADIYGGYLYN